MRVFWLAHLYASQSEKNLRNVNGGEEGGQGSMFLPDEMNALYFSSGSDLQLLFIFL